jgi:DNA (cytosine-5)-methyltransferase 1
MKNIIHLGDITKISGYTAPVVDCIIGGSPCQDLSAAGKRAGLDGERSGLYIEQVRIVKEMRERDERNGRTGVDVRPRYMVWENVCGALSSGKPKGDDFRIVLEELARIVEEGVSIPRPPKGKWNNTGVIIGDGWSIAWRISDAQYWGVPQRRRRITLVADFGGHNAPRIVFGENEHHGSAM